MAAVLKTVVLQGTVGSNPTSSAIYCNVTLKIHRGQKPTSLKTEILPASTRTTGGSAGDDESVVGGKTVVLQGTVGSNPTYSTIQYMAVRL